MSKVIFVDKDGKDIGYGFDPVITKEGVTFEGDLVITVPGTVASLRVEATDTFNTDPVDEVKKCHVCDKPAFHKCTDTPNGGWGTMKCGAPLCKDHSKCGCTETLIY